MELIYKLNLTVLGMKFGTEIYIYQRRELPVLVSLLVVQFLPVIKPPLVPTVLLIYVYNNRKAVRAITLLYVVHLAAVLWKLSMKLMLHLVLRVHQLSLKTLVPQPIPFLGVQLVLLVELRFTILMTLPVVM